MWKIDNSPSEMSKRLLSLYPISVIKKEYEQKGSLEDVHKHIVKKHITDDIHEDCLRLFGHTKQHVYFYNHKHNNISALNEHSFFNAQNCVKKNVIKKSSNLFEAEYLLSLGYHFLEVNGRTVDKRELKFLWPIRIIVTSKFLQLRIVIMESRMRSFNNYYFQVRDTDEDTIVRSVLNVLSGARSDWPLDLNRGIKHFWNKDFIDAKRVAHKSSKSMDNSSMDSGMTYKKEYPKRFSNSISNPLTGKSVFSVLKEDGWPAKFTIDPSRGFLGFPTFQMEIDAVNSFVEELLKCN